MIDAFAPRRSHNVLFQERRAKISWWLMFLSMLGVSVVVGLLMIRERPSLSALAWLFYIVGLIAICYQPRFGVYLLIGLALFGDANLHPWYPFTKNFSSRESLMYLSDSLIISPLELYIAFTAFIWLGRMAMERRIRFYFGPIFWPAVGYLTFVTIGLLYGLARGGNLVIALWEARSMYYLLAMLVLTSNLIRTRRHVNTLLWIITIDLFLKGTSGMMYVATFLNWDMGSVERIAEHSMSIHFNVFFVLMVAAWVYHDSTIRRIVMPLMAPFVFYSFIANHRRAGFLTLGIAMALIVLLLYREHRKLFWAIAPTGAVAFMAYLVVFWNNSGGIGMMARAVRSVVGQPTARDAASNIYRDIENINIMFTIKSQPLTGVGFGQKFYIIAPMPDISMSFEWWEYITHNSIMWVWMKIGMFGFFFLLLMIGTALMVGGRAIWVMPRGPLRVAALTATLYVLMHFVYAYVDMSWDTNSMMLMGTMMGLLNCLDLVAANPVPLPAKRWPWQPDPQPLLELDPPRPPPIPRRFGPRRPMPRQPVAALSQSDEPLSPI